MYTSGNSVTHRKCTSKNKNKVQTVETSVNLQSTLRKPKEKHSNEIFFQTKSCEIMEHKLMFNKWFYRRLPYFLRRRLTPQQSPFVVVVLLAFTVIILQSISFLSNEHQQISDTKIENQAEKVSSQRPRLRRPLANVIGIQSNLLRHYVPGDDNLFECLASSKKIPFDWVNDDYCDCVEDGSDEPATGACQKGKFYCTQRDSRYVQQK